MRSLHERDEGTTLIEVLVAVVILGIAFVAILGSMTTFILASDIHRKQATAETVLRSYAEAVEGEPYTSDYLTNCSPGYSPAFPAPAGYTVSVTAVTYLSIATGDPASCPQGTTLQRVSLQVVSPNGHAIETVQILKRKP